MTVSPSAPVPASGRFFEDLTVGATETIGAYPVTREEVIAFARAYDPQPFHLDDAAAAATHFGRLAASGWHSCAMVMRLMVDHWAKVGLASLGAPGIDALRFVAPVYPGDSLSVTVECLETRRSATRPTMGLARFRQTVTNQDGKVVLTMEPTIMVATRAPEAP